MPARQPFPQDILASSLRKLRDDASATQRQQTYVWVDPTGATGDPSNPVAQYAVAVVGYLGDVASIDAWGIAAWDQTTSAWVQIDSPGGGITELTSTDLSVTITDPTGPITDLSVSAGLATFTYPMTWAVQGTILVPTGAVGFLPPSFVPIFGSLSATLVEVRYVCRAGSVDFDVTQNGTGVVSTLTATTTPTTTTVSVALADGDALAPVVTSIVSGPADGLTVTLVVELS